MYAHNQVSIENVDAEWDTGGETTLVGVGPVSDDEPIELQDADVETAPLSDDHDGFDWTQQPESFASGIRRRMRELPRYTIHEERTKPVFPAPPSLRRAPRQERQAQQANLTLRDLPRYSLNEERTKPGVVLLDWNGEDEDTVKWETVRRDAPVASPIPPEVAEIASPRLGLGVRRGGMILGFVLGIAISVGLFAMLLPYRDDLRAAPPSLSAPSERAIEIVSDLSPAHR